MLHAILRPACDRSSMSRPCSRRRARRSWPSVKSADEEPAAMPFSDHIRICNSYDPARALPLFAGHSRIGLLRRDNAEVLRRFPAVFSVTTDAVRLVVDGDPTAISRAVEAVVDALVSE